MTAASTVTDAEQTDRTARARIDASTSTVSEIQSFVRRNDYTVHLERRGGRTVLVID